MRLLNPWAMLSLLLALPIIALYILRLHRRRVVVPSLLLWSAILEDRRANRPWQKLKRHWLLLLQLLILLALALSLARPAIPVPLTAHGQVIVLLDTSASMQSALVDAGGAQSQETRFDVALDKLRDLAAALEPDDRVALVSVSAEPQILLQSGDAAAFRRALDNAQPTDGVADWTAAAALAAGLAGGDSVTTLLVTDAAMSENEDLPPLPGTVQLVSVAQDAANTGIVSLALRPGREGTLAFVRLYNAGPESRRALSLYADGVLVARQEVDLPTDGGVSLSFPDVPVLDWVEARLDSGDALTLDDRAWVAYTGVVGESHLLLVTPGNRFLAQALRSLPGVELAVSPDLSPMGATSSNDQDMGISPGYGALVVDGPVTETLPTLPMWLIDPGPGSLCGTAGEPFTPTTVVRGQWSHPLLQYVEWDEVHIARARYYTPPDDAEVLLETALGPLVWVVERSGQRLACMAFDIHDSDLPLRLAFPILTANLTGWLVPQASTEPVLPYPAGESWSLSLPPGATSAQLFDAQGGHSRTVDLEHPGTLPRAAGLYRMVAQTPEGAVTRYAALSLLDEAESDLRPQDVTVGGRAVVSATGEVAQGWQDLGRWVALTALVLLLVEVLAWWGPKLRGLYSRGEGGLPRLQRLARSIGSAGLLRLALVVLILFAGLGLRWSRRTRDLAVVFLLDRSASMDALWEAEVTFVTEALESKSPRDRAALVVFGGDAWVDRGLSVSPELAAIATLPRATATDIESAVRLGMALVPDGAPGRLVLFSDGLETSGEANRALQAAYAQGLDVQIVTPGEVTARPETWVAGLRLPAQVYPGDRVIAGVTVASNTPQDVQLTWSVGSESGQGAVAVANQETFAFSFMVDTSGFIPLRACLDVAEDTFAQNNCAAGWVKVVGNPQVLVVGEPEYRDSLVSALEEANLSVAAITAGNFPLTLQGLGAYAAVVLANTPAHDLPMSSPDLLHDFVRDLGGGLVAVGGPRSYGLGGWLGTPLEDVLPVEMRVQDPQRFPPLAMVILIDKSGSMGASDSGGVPKIRLAAESAIRVVETLNDTDTLAVVAFDDRPADTLGPAQIATDRDSLISALLRLQAGGGGIYVYESMAYAADLLEQGAYGAGVQRHILLLSDGSDAEHQEGTFSLVQELLEQNVTVSTVALGDGQDVKFLSQVAEAGNGRFYLARQSSELPAIFAEETAKAKRSYIVEERFYPHPVSTWPPLQGTASTPPLLGYVATTPKAAAQVVWEGAVAGDPLLSVWQYGLGQSVAWTSDATGLWGTAWVSWDEFSRFWGSVVRGVLPPPSDTGVALSVDFVGNTLQVQADVLSEDGDYVNNLELWAQAVQPEGSSTGLATRLQQRAPGRYSGSILLDVPGPLLLRLFGDRDQSIAISPPPPLETIPGDSAKAVAQLAAQSGAELIVEPGNTFKHDLRGSLSGQLLSPLLLWLAVVLWPVDIAWRRLALSRADWRRLWARIRALLPQGKGTKKAPVSGVETQDTLAATLRRRTRSAQEDTPVVPGPPPVDVSSPVVKKDVVRQSPAKPEIAKSQEEDNETLGAKLKRRVKK